MWFLPCTIKAAVVFCSPHTQVYSPASFNSTSWISSFMTVPSCLILYLSLTLSRRFSFLHSTWATLVSSQRRVAAWPSVTSSSFRLSLMPAGSAEDATDRGLKRSSKHNLLVKENRGLQCLQAWSHIYVRDQVLKPLCICNRSEGFSLKLQINSHDYDMQSQTQRTCAKIAMKVEKTWIPTTSSIMRPPRWNWLLPWTAREAVDCLSPHTQV